MKAKVLTKFEDKYTGEIYKVGKEITVSRERFEEILTTGPFVEEVVEPVKEAAKTAKPKAKKKASK